MSSTHYQCCFCGKTIEPDKVEPLLLAVSERSAWDAESGEVDDARQALYAHADCLGGRLHKTVPFLNHKERLEDDDL